MGTLFDLAPLRERLAGIGAPEATFEAWFGRTLHGATALTLAGEFAPFAELAESSLATTLAQLDLDPSDAEGVVAGLRELPAFPDAEPALARLTGAGVRIWTLTNGGEESTRALLEGAALDRYVERVATVAEVRRYKPHGDVYRHALQELDLAPEETALVAAHAWDTLGARAVCMRALWVDRLERVWPFPLPETERVRGLEEAAGQLLAEPGER